LKVITRLFHFEYIFMCHYTLLRGYIRGRGFLVLGCNAPP
jgi:hypothetical protein